MYWSWTVGESAAKPVVMLLTNGVNVVPTEEGRITLPYIFPLLCYRVVEHKTTKYI
jgi:hypothetical protein